MIFFTLIEGLNKALGVFILAALTRYLEVDEFVEYSAILVVFGYYLEVAFFSYQKRNLVDASESHNFPESNSFVIRQRVLIICSSISAVAFINAAPSGWGFHVFPLMLILLLPVFTYDFMLYAAGCSNGVVLARFVAQVTALVLIFLFSFFDISTAFVYWVNLAQTIILTCIVLIYVRVKVGFKICDFVRRFFSYRWRLSELREELFYQKDVFVARISIIVIVTYEIAVFTYLENESVASVALGNRLALVFLPFIHFYLNLNIKKVDEANYSRYIVFVGVSVLLFVLASPVVVPLLLGAAYLSLGFMFNYYFSVLLLQAFVNFSFVCAIRNNTSKIMAYSLMGIVAIFSVVVFVLGATGRIEEEQIFALFVFKALLVILLVGDIGFRRKVLTVGVFVFVIVSTYLLGVLGYFEFMVFIAEQWV